MSNLTATHTGYGYMVEDYWKVRDNENVGGRTSRTSLKSPHTTVVNEGSCTKASNFDRY
jgi:hypothetical protein